MKKILVVDDTKNIRNLLTKCLELEGYEVKTASNGKEAIEFFKNDTFDLAFLDIKIPEIRGTKVLKIIREMGIKIPIIIITAYGTIKNAIDCTNMGAVAYLLKPFSAEKIISVINELKLCPPLNMHKPKIKEIEDLLLKNELENAENLIRLGLYNEPTKSDYYLLYSKLYKKRKNIDLEKKFFKIYTLFK